MKLLIRSQTSTVQPLTKLSTVVHIDLTHITKREWRLLSWYVILACHRHMTDCNYHWPDFVTWGSTNAGWATGSSWDWYRCQIIQSKHINLENIRYVQLLLIVVRLHNIDTYMSKIFALGSWCWFLAATKQLYELLIMFVCPPATHFSLCSLHRIIMKFAGVITNDVGEVHAKGQGQRSKFKVTKFNTQLNRFRTVTPVWIHIWSWNDAQSLMLLRRGAPLFYKVNRQISRSHG